ncbi:MAG: cobalt-zinc-cadmium efflux system membrane fusion protein, partial [Planctomycetota bacterium]
TSDQIQETIPLAPIRVHADLASAFAAAEADAVEDPRDAVPFLLEQQWKIALRMEQVQLRTLTNRLQVPGEIQAPSFGMAVVAAPLDGLLRAPESGALPQVGDRVEAGQLLGTIQPPLTTSDAAQLSANRVSLQSIETELLVRELELRASVLEVEQALGQSAAQLEFARQRLARVEDLRTKDLGTVAELEAARRDLQIALGANEVSQGLKESYASSLERLAALRANRADNDAATPSDGLLLQTLIAPISGEIIASEHVVGEHIEGQSAVFRILDLGHVWIEAQVSEFDLGALSTEPNAFLQVSAYPDRSFDVLGDMGGRLVNTGRVVDPETRTVGLRYEVPNPEELFLAGMFADVFLETDRVLDAVAVPESAVVMDMGQPVVFALVHGEMFQRRVVELGVRDGRFVEVIAGLAEGDRVVTDGAYLVKLASASPAAFGEGHAH